LSDDVYKVKPLELSLLKSEAPIYAEVDSEVVDCVKKISILDIKLQLIDEMKKILLSRNWIIKNAIEFLKFKNGLL
jgi:hypothetical protein